MNNLATTISWHAEQWRQIDSYKGNPPHALLLMGSAGLGKQQFAYKLAQKILCPSSLQHLDVEDGTSCSSCRLIESSTNPDLLIVAADTAATKQILIEEIHEVRSFLQTTSHLGNGKLVIINNADKMNNSSANALLKVLEEPPSGKYLLLTSSSASTLLPTILSRCVKVQFLPPPMPSIKEWLAANYSDADHKLLEDDLLFAINGFSPLAILAMLQNGKAQLLHQLNQDLDHPLSFTSAKLAAYKELDLVEILDLILWRTEKQIMRVFYDTPQGETKPLFSLRSLLLARRSMLLRKLNLNRDLLLEECLLLMPRS